MIGGIDIVLTAPASTPVGDIVVRRMRQFWPEGIFQDAESVTKHSLGEAWVVLTGTKSREFFVYRDSAAARRWDETGATPENQNTMMHFLVRRCESDGTEIQELTVVCDEKSADVVRLIGDLEMTFRSPQMYGLVA